MWKKTLKSSLKWLLKQSVRGFLKIRKMGALNKLLYFNLNKTLLLQRIEYKKTYKARRPVARASKPNKNISAYS
jgi:hypothetical protein